MSFGDGCFQAARFHLYKNAGKGSVFQLCIPQRGGSIPEALKQVPANRRAQRNPRFLQSANLCIDSRLVLAQPGFASTDAFLPNPNVATKRATSVSSGNGLSGSSPPARAISFARRELSLHGHSLCHRLVQLLNQCVPLPYHQGVSSRASVTFAMQFLTA